MLGIYFVIFGVWYIGSELAPMPTAISNDVGFFYHIKGRIFFSWFLAFLTPYFFVSSQIAFALLILDSVFLTAVFAMSFHPQSAEYSYRIQEASGLKVTRATNTKSSVCVPSAVPVALTTSEVSAGPATTVVIDLPTDDGLFTVDDEAATVAAAPVPQPLTVTVAEKSSSSTALPSSLEGEAKPKAFIVAV
jgi:hypothetical protein